MEICASNGGDNAITIFDILTGDTIVTLRGHEDMINCVSFSPCGTLLASGSSDCTVKLWDCQTWQILQSFNDMKSHAYVRSVGFSAAAERIISSHLYEGICVWSVTGKTLLRIETGIPKPFCACFTNNDTTIAVTCKEVVNVYDAYSGELMQSLWLHSSRIRSINFSYDGSMMASAGHGCSVKLSNVTSGEVIRELRGHSEAVSQVCFNADASRIVSSSCDNTARIWDVSTGECQLTLVGHKHYIYSCCFSEDGSKGITAGDGGSVKVWDSYTGEELRTFCNSVGAISSLSCCPSTAGSYI